MIDPGLRTRFLAAGTPKHQIEAALGYFEQTSTAPAITSPSEYAAARETYARMDACLPPEELQPYRALYPKPWCAVVRVGKTGRMIRPWNCG